MEDSSIDSLIIPLKGKDVFVEIFPEEFAEIPTNSLMDLLQDQESEIALWNQAAFLYMKSNQAKKALAILEEACDLPVMDQEGRARTLSATGIATIAVGNDLDEAERKFTLASKVDQFFPMHWLGKAMNSLTYNAKNEKVDLKQAKLFLDTVTKQRGKAKILPALMVSAAIMFMEGNYIGAQEAYAEVIRRYPQSGAMSRVGFGLASYKLGQVDRAKAAFERALQMEPECVDAMVGMAVIDLASTDPLAKDFSQTTEKAIKMLSMANLMDHTNAMVQNHLADHYWKKWTNVTGTVDVTKGSNIIKGSQSIALEPGDRVRIGQKFVATIKEDETRDDDEESTFLVDRAWNGATEKGLKIYKKDYDRVTALAKGAYSSTKVKGIQAESLYFLARVYHTKEEYKNAGLFYDKAIDYNEKFAPALLGQAQLFVVMNDTKAAIRNLKKVLQLSPTSSDALALLGLLEVKEAKSKEAIAKEGMSGKLYEEGLVHLRKAIELDPLNHELLIFEAIALREHRVNFVRALKSYQTALDVLKKKNMPIPADLYVNIAVLYHETKQLNDSLEMYKLALKTISPEKIVDVAVNDKREGGEISDPSNDMFYDYVDSKIAVKALGGSKVAMNGKLPKEVPFKENDRVKLADAFTCKIVSIENTSEGTVLNLDSDFDPMEIEKENEKEAVHNVYVQRENNLLNDPEVLTIAFNIARLHENAGRTLAAIELHKAILKRNPSYLNSYLRLACIARDNSSLKECSQWLKIATKAGEGNPEVLVLVGNLHLSLADFHSASKIFEMLLAKRIQKVHTYSELSMANLYLENLHVVAERYERTMKYCIDYFRSVLKKEPSNNYAANGLGSVLAEKGEIMRAKEVFNRVREVSGDSVPAALLNLGHIYLAQKKHPEALQMYNTYLKRLEDGSAPVTSKSRADDIVDVLVYIAFAYYDWARITELHDDANAAPADGRYREAIKVLDQAREKANRRKETIEFNLCVVKLQAANCVLLKITRNIPRTAEEVGNSLNELKDSLATVAKLSERKKEDPRKIEMRSAAIEQFLKDCKNNIKIAESHYADELRRAEEVEQERELQRQAAEAARKEEALREELAREEEKKIQQERDQKAEDKLRRAQELQDEWKQQQAAKQTKKEGKATKKSSEAPPVVEEEPHGLFDSDDDDDDFNETLAQSEKKESKSQETGASDLFGDSDDDDDDEVPKEESKAQPKPAPTARKEDLFGDDSDEEELEDEMPDKDEEKPANDGNDLFGDSDSDNDDQADKKRQLDEQGDEPESKKRRVLDDDDDDE